MGLRKIGKLTDLEIERRGSAIERVKVIIAELHEVMTGLVGNNDILIRKHSEIKDNFLRIESELEKINEEKIPYIHDKLDKKIYSRLLKLESRTDSLELPFYKRIWRKLRGGSKNGKT